MTGPTGDLDIAREYTCGCRYYRDALGIEYGELGLFCFADKPDWPDSPSRPSESHANRRLIRGEETQVGLFS